MAKVINDTFVKKKKILKLLHEQNGNVSVRIGVESNVISSNARERISSQSFDDFSNK